MYISVLCAARLFFVEPVFFLLYCFFLWRKKLWYDEEKQKNSYVFIVLSCLCRTGRRDSAEHARHTAKEEPDLWKS